MPHNNILGRKRILLTGVQDNLLILLSLVLFILLLKLYSSTISNELKSTDCNKPFNYYFILSNLILNYHIYTSTISKRKKKNSIILFLFVLISIIYLIFKNIKTKSSKKKGKK